MSILDVANYLAGNTTNYSNLTTQSGLDATTVDKIKRMEQLTNAACSSTSCFIGVNSPVMSSISSASYIHQMAAILNEGMQSVNTTPNSVFDAKPSYATSPTPAAAPASTPKTEEAKTEAPKTEAKKTNQETPDAFNRKQEAAAAEAKKQAEQERVQQQMSVAFPKRAQSDKAEAAAAKARAEKIKNPSRGSELERLRSQLETVQDLEAKGITCGYLPSKSYLEKRIKEIESGEAERTLTIKIKKLEEETKEYQGETHWYNFTKNAKLRELEDLKAQRANLY